MPGGGGGGSSSSATGTGSPNAFQFTGLRIESFPGPTVQEIVGFHSMNWESLQSMQINFLGDSFF